MEFALYFTTLSHEQVDLFEVYPISQQQLILIKKNFVWFIANKNTLKEGKKVNGFFTYAMDYEMN